jgi:hypothetical protein
MLGVLVSDEEPLGMGERVRWRYHVVDDVDPTVVRATPRE